LTAAFVLKLQISTSSIVWQKKANCGANCWGDYIFPLVQSPVDVIIIYNNNVGHTFHAGLNTVANIETYNLYRQCSGPCVGTTNGDGQALIMEDKGTFLADFATAFTG
jgi:hypothetical protein